MKPKYIGCFSVLSLLLTSCAVKEKNSNSHSRPNFVFILVDDLGYKDLGCYGSDFYETPNIDRLALQGIRFTASYTASAVCSPTRASILTGKYPARLGITDWTGPEEWHPHGNLKTPEIKEALPRDELTIAEVLENYGYTNLYIGKWHLGDEDNYPEYHGFSRSVGATNAGAPPSYFFPYFRANWEGTGWPVDIKDLNKKGKKDEYLTDRLTDEALNFLDTIGISFCTVFFYHLGFSLQGFVNCIMR
jgi:arylsulfatase A-like enzyme